MMQRVARGNSVTLSHTFYVDGIPTDPTPDTATVTIVRDDGTPIVTAAPATEAGTGIVTYTLAPAQNPSVDLLTATWTATFGAQSQVFTDMVEVVGGFLFGIAEARAMTPLDNDVTYPTQRILDVRTLVEEAIEDACGVAFVPRYRRERVSGTGTHKIVVTQPRVSAVRAVTFNGAVLVDVGTIVGDDAGVLDYPAGWMWGAENYDITYEHGYPYPPARIHQAALVLARSWLVDGPMDERTTAFTTPDGTFALSTPGMRGSIFGIPEVDAAVKQYDERAMVA